MDLPAGRRDCTVDMEAPTPCLSCGHDLSVVAIEAAPLSSVRFTAHRVGDSICINTRMPVELLMILVACGEDWHYVLLRVCRKWHGLWPTGGGGMTSALLHRPQFRSPSQ